MIKAKYYSRVVLLFFIASISFSPITVSALNYDLGIDEGYYITWEYTYIDNVLLQLLNDNEGYNWGLTREVGDKVKWELENIDSFTSGGKDFWKLAIDIYYEGSYSSSDTRFVYKDPEDLGNDWDNPVQGATTILVGENVDAYLTTLITTIGSADIFKEGLGFKEDPPSHQMEIRKYNTYGIMENYSIYYDYQKALEYVLSDFGNIQNSDPVFIYILIGLVSTVALTALIVAGVKRSKQPTRTQKPVYRGGTYQSSESPYRIARPRAQPTEGMFREIEKPLSKPVTPPPVKTPKIVGTCHLCGAQRDEDATFCPSCGNKYE